MKIVSPCLIGRRIKKNKFLIKRRHMVDSIKNVGGARQEPFSVHADGEGSEDIETD